jgi:cell division protein FtsW (lipid II flippase)
VSLLALVAGWRAFRHDALLWFLVLTVVGGIVFYLLLYTMRPFYSIERYLMHIAPMAVLAAARAWQLLQSEASTERTEQCPGLARDTTG